MTKKPTIAELTAALQQERADAENMRRRHHQQMFSLRETVKADIVRELLPIIDNFERALKHSPLSSSGERSETRESSKIPDQVGNDKEKEESNRFLDFVKGVQGIVKQFEKTLADIGVERIKTVGEVFDPHLHEAVAVEESGNPSTSSGQAVEIVSEEIQPGFKLGDEVIRPATVKVKMEKSK